MMKNNKNNQEYTCGICGKTYNHVADRMMCEHKCIKKQEEEEKKAAEAKKNAEKDARFAEASAAIDNALDLVAKCQKDYGTFHYNGKFSKCVEPLNVDFIPSKLLHHFWF